jgi:hypothetical protein
VGRDPRADQRRYGLIADAACEGAEAGLGDEAVDDDAAEHAEVVVAEFGDGGEAVAEDVLQIQQA